MKKDVNRINKFRLYFVLSITLLAFIIIIVRLYTLQIIDHKYYYKKKLQQSKSVVEVSPERGAIFDRNGRVLALTADSFSVYLINKHKKNSFEELEKLKKVVFFSSSDFRKIRERISKGKRFIWIKRKTDETVLSRITRLNLKNVGYIIEKKRYYPNDTLACHVLGLVNIDNKGLEGVERYFDSTLSGVPGKIIIKRDARRKVFEEVVLQKPEKGEDLYLTIDKVIQYITEKELEKAVTENKARWGTAIIMNSQTGEILAMASYPSYNPNNPTSITKFNRRNRAIEENYTPGSTFKIVTLASAFEANIIRKGKLYNCGNGVFKYNGIEIRDHARFGALTPKEILAKSSNICSAKIAHRMRRAYFYKMIKKFHLGRKTGIELPGEESGILRRLTLWTDISSFYLGFGYEISVTPIQILEVANIIATGGYYIKPTIIERKPYSVRRERVISSRTANILKEFMKEVVISGTGKLARLEDYPVSGKTGTAELLIEGKYSKDRHVASFVGFVPADNPKLTAVVVIYDPMGDKYYGGEVAAPVFSRIMRETLTYLNILPKKKKNIIIVRKRSSNEYTS